MNENELVTMFEGLQCWNELFDKSRTPELLYHYTTFDGLQGILKDNSLRATFSKTLNDGSEWEFGKQVVKQYTTLKNGLEWYEAFELPSWMEAAPPPTEMFVTCFCEQPNLLSMWRSYTAQGGGFCLGFEGRALDDLQRDNMVAGEFAARLVKVYYGTTLPEELRNVIASKAHVMAEWVLENMIKNIGFQEEQEWRILVPGPKPELMSFHGSHAGIKASVQIRNHRGKLPLKTIVYGPTLRADTGIVLKWMLEHYGYPDVEVQGSDIPYRL